MHERLTIVHTNDMHGTLSPKLRARLLAERETDPDLILLDAGDAVRSGNVGIPVSGEPILREMSRLGYDAMVVGNREFHFAPAGFRAKVRDAVFPVLCANLTAGSSYMSSHVRPWCTLARPGWSVAVLGLTVPMITSRMAAAALSPFRFDTGLRTASQLTQTIREATTVDLLIVLSHLGLNADRAIAAAVPGIDLIIGGHTHAFLPEGERIGDTTVVQAGSRSRGYGRVEVFRHVGVPEVHAQAFEL